MNSEERHQQRLQTNELGQAVQAVGNRVEEHATTIVIAICAILVIAAGFTWWSRQTSASAAKAWTRLETAENVNDFGDVAESFKGTAAGRWAKLRESELYLQTGLSQLFSDREVALTDLKKARAGFEQLASETPIDPTIKERALFGLALTLESTCDGDTSKATDAYQKLLNDVPETFYKPLAEQRIAALKTGGTKEFYAWFSKQNPKPTDIRPKDGGFNNDFDLKLPGPKSEFNLDPNLLKPSDTKPAPDAKEGDPKPEQPAADATKTETPEDKPAKEGEAKPDEKPAEKPEADKTPAPKAEKDAEKKE